MIKIRVRPGRLMIEWNIFESYGKRVQSIWNILTVHSRC